MLKELRTQTFLPWDKRLWDTPNVAHDNPHDQRFHASLILGFTDTAARDAFFASSVIEELSRPADTARLRDPRLLRHRMPSPTSRTATSSRTTRSERPGRGAGPPFHYHEDFVPKALEFLKP